MDLAVIWDHFLQLLNKEEAIHLAKMRKSAGIPFLYITSSLPKEEVEHLIKSCAGKAMRGKRLHAETHFFRKNVETFIYRHRFYVPQEKMFCCGNICEDCIRLRPYT
ncbi:MAG: hypothetical protein H0Z31_02995 [Bacillus sp. (in: Bacteria)]|jgi:hypothetical protein|nr:hypothetical protein [Bacillus sp. (in: firmicutes)]